MTHGHDTSRVQVHLSNAEVLRTRRLVGIFATVAAVAALLFWFATTLRTDGNHDMFNLVDVGVYRAGAQAVLDGRPLYEPVMGPLYFTYPPFAALLFLPMALVGDRLVKGIWVLLSVALVAWVVNSAGQGTRVRAFMTEATVWKLGIALAVVIDPVWVTIYLGQINLVILALVLADFFIITSGRHRRWGGILLGVAIGIKLTPLIFLAPLILLRKFRAALTALASFAATLVIALVALPASTVTYWTQALADTQRISPSDVTGNQSWAGVLIRELDGEVPPGLWLLLAGLSGLIGLIVAFRLVRRDHTIAGVGVMGVAGCAASPFSWGHHWVWLLLLVTWSGGMAIQYLVAHSRGAIWYVALAIVTFVVSARYYVAGRGSMGSFAVYLDHPVGAWAFSYPVVGMALVVAIGIVAFAQPGWLEPVLQFEPGLPDDVDTVEVPRTVTPGTHPEFDGGGPDDRRAGTTEPHEPRGSGPTDRLPD